MSRLDSLLALHQQTPDDADLHFMIASEHFQAERHDDALRWLASYVERGTDVGAAYRMMAECHLAAGDATAAKAALRTGVDAALRGGHPSMAAEYRERLAELDEA